MNRLENFLCVAIASLAGCAPTFMDRTLLESIPTDNLSKIQYRLNEKIILRREMSTDERDITDGHQIKIVKGHRIEEIVFPKDSAGVSVGPKDNRQELLISFEGGTKEFPDPSLRFYLSDQGEFILESGQSAPYQGKTYVACIWHAADDMVNMLTFQGINCDNHRKAHLIVDLKQDKQLTHEHRVVSGRHVGE